MSSDADRDHGLELGDLESALESVDYPASAEAVREAVGDQVITHPSGQTTVGEALTGQEGVTFQSAEDVVQAVKTGVESEAVGREGYTDRGVGTEANDADETSF